ncbi:MAG: hypothetical protein HOV81_41090, partial [Kofleriaceae bacterium]|nr:hypothetical protein [Kofleriaceae bacterium]
VVVAACGNDNKDGVLPKVDASADSFIDPYRDAPPTSTIEVTVSGRASEQSVSGSMPLTGVVITAYRNADDATPLAMTTTNGNGDYTITIQTMGESIDGYLKATRTGYVDTYLYPPYALTMDFSNASIIMVKPGTFDALSTLAQGNQQAGNGLVALVVTDGTAPISGAVVTSTPTATPVRYNQQSGTVSFPSSTATSTYTDGIAYLFNAPPGLLTVSATHPSMTLASHGLKVRADVLTTTVIVP